jgi:hypothetical protein
MLATLLLDYLDHRRLPAATWEDSTALHRALCEAAPELYLHLLADPRADVSHKRQVLLTLITHPAARGIDWRRMVEMLGRLPPAEGLQVLDVLRTSMTNRRRAREVGLAFLLGHAQFPNLAAGHRQRLIRLFRHVLGERTWSACCRYLANKPPEGEAFLQRKLLRFATDETVARETLAFLAGVAFTPTHPLLMKSAAARRSIREGAGLPRETLFGLRVRFQPRPTDSQIRLLAGVEETATRADGPLTALYKKALFGELSQEAAAQQLAAQHEHLVGLLPLVETRLALVLDLSGSAVSSGERMYHPSALGLALARMLQQHVREVSLHLVGGSSLVEGAAVTALENGMLLRPQGASDLASGILEAARQHSPEGGRPQAILVITDGYENLRQGDAAEVVRGLRQLGLTMPVYQLLPLFAASEDVSQRALGEPIQVLPVEHEVGVGEVLARLRLSAGGPAQLSEPELEQVRRLVVAQ